MSVEEAGRTTQDRRRRSLATDLAEWAMMRPAPVDRSPCTKGEADVSSPYQTFGGTIAAARS
jgi:hypothetical protein